MKHEFLHYTLARYLGLRSNEELLQVIKGSMKQNCSVTSAVEITNGHMLVAGVGSVFGCLHLQKQKITLQS